MKAANILKIIKIDAFSSTPKYQQLVNAILGGIQKKLIRRGDLLPSINEVSFELDIARVTVEKGYNQLRSLGVLDSVPGKGYFIKSTEIAQNLRIFLLFNKLSAHKKIIYDAFVETLGNQAAIDFYVYNNDVGLFNRLIENRKDDYTHFVIIPHFIESEEKAYEIIETLPKDQLILVDKLIPQLKGSFGAVYENFEKDIYQALEQAKDALSKYHTLKIIFPENSYVSQGIVKGFIQFCQNYAFNYKVVHSIIDEIIEEGEVYINLMEDDLVILIEKIIDQKLQIGKQVGVISYNETPLKKLIMNGLTTISTDFKAMGKTAAELVLTNSKSHIENPFYLTMRGSV